MPRPGAPLASLFVLALFLAAPVALAQKGKGRPERSGSTTAKKQGQPGPGRTGAPQGQQQPGEFNLDLTSELTRAELLPRVVLVGLDVPQRAGTAVANKWLKKLQTSIRTNHQWVLSAQPKQVREKLGGGYTAALSCQEASCLAESAETLEADLLVTARLALEDKAWTLRLWTYNPDLGRVETDMVAGRSPRDAKFQKAGAKLLARRIKGLARLRSILKVYVNVPQAVIRLGGRTLGMGSIEARVAPVEGHLIVEADEFTSFTRTVSFTPGERNTVEVHLESAGPPPGSLADLELAKKRGALPAVFSRPALYTAALGILAIGAGLIVREQAWDIANRARDVNGDGIVDITRRERLEARHKTNLSTALMAGGAATAGGSALWLLLVPAKGEPQKAARGLASSSPRSDTSLYLVLGGSF